MRYLRWLTLLGLLGLLGLFTDYRMFQVLFVFLAFLPLFGYDERKEAIFKQAATIAFVVTTITIAGTFVYVGLMMKNGVQAEMLSQFGLAFAFIFIIHVLTFVLSYMYYEVRGFRQ